MYFRFFLQSALRLARLALERDPGMAPLLTREPEGIPLIVAEEIVLDAFGLPKKDTKGKLKLDKKDKDSTEKKDKEDKRDEKGEKSTPEKKKRRTRIWSKCAPSQEEEEVPQQGWEALFGDNSHDEGQAPGQGEEEGAQQWMAAREGCIERQQL